MNKKAIFWSALCAVVLIFALVFAFMPGPAKAKGDGTDADRREARDDGSSEGRHAAPAQAQQHQTLAQPRPALVWVQKVSAGELCRIPYRAGERVRFVPIGRVEYDWFVGTTKHPYAHFDLNGACHVLKSGTELPSNDHEPVSIEADKAKWAGFTITGIAEAEVVVCRYPAQEGCPKEWYDTGLAISRGEMPNPRHGSSEAQDGSG